MKWRLRSCLALSLLMGCTFAPGTGFGVLQQVRLTSRFAQPAARLDEAGRWKTDNDYRLSLKDLNLTLGELAIKSGRAAATSATVVFDPAKPPEGYSLCHNGHCHRSDGALIDYETIKAELAGGGKAALTILSVPLTRTFSLLQGAVETAVEPCSGGCRLEPGAWSQADLSFGELTAKGTVTDGVSPARFAGSRDWTVSFTPSALSGALRVAIDRKTPADLRLVGTMALSERLFDGIDWAALAKKPGPIALAAEPAALAQLRENFSASDRSLAMEP